MFCSEKIDQLCKERLDIWRLFLVENDSTPFALVSIGHNDNIGKLSLCITEGVSTHVVIDILKDVVKRLEKQRKGG